MRDGMTLDKGDCMGQVGIINSQEDNEEALN